MRFLRLLPLFLLVITHAPQKGCFKDKKQEEPNYAVLTANAYDMYILDMPMSRDLYREKKIKSRKMMEVSTIDLPAEEGYVVRQDDFDEQGRILKTTYMKEAEKDSIKYEYHSTGQIEKVHAYPQEGDSTTVHYFYDEYGMMSHALFYRDKVTAYEFDHNFYGKMTDKRLSEDSPSYSPVREIYKFNSHGYMIQKLVLTKNVPTAKQKRYYDKKNRISKTEELANGIVMSSRNYLYNEQGLLSIRKDIFRLSRDEEEMKVYEFIYEYH